MKESRKFEVVECCGTPYEIGKQYGAACRISLVTSIEALVKEYCRSPGGLADIKPVLGKYVSLVKQFDPELIDVLQGQADGAGVTLEEIFLLRCNFELSFYYQEMKTLCTSFAVTGRATRDGKTIIGQNFDATIGRPVDIVKTGRSDGMTQLSLVFWGACELTLNSSGFGMVLNVVVSPAGAQKLNIPACCVMPKAMRQARIGDALGVFCSAGRSMMYYCLASREGDIIGIETYPDDYSVLAPEKDVLVHANHYHTDRFKKGELVYQGSPGSYIREPRLKRLIETHHGDITVEMMMQFMSDHNNYPRSICNHPSGNSQYQGTLASVIMVPEDKCIYVSGGPPCQYDYLEYRL
jgi:isopenicillin-N N-acyltransferase-like protein